MQWIPATAWLAVPVAALVAPIAAQAKIFVSQEQVAQRLFPGETLTPSPVVLTEAQRALMREKSSVREPFQGERVWRAARGGWLIVDEVVGKHEMVKYALALNADGSVKGLEIMSYVESYGYEVAEEAWRQQFVGKTSEASFKLNQDIRNISGATLSCKHVTDGVKRLMVMFDLVLRGRAA